MGRVQTVQTVVSLGASRRKRSPRTRRMPKRTASSKRRRRSKERFGNRFCTELTSFRLFEETDLRLVKFLLAALQALPPSSLRTPDGTLLEYSFTRDLVFEKHGVRLTLQRFRCGQNTRICVHLRVE